LAVVRLAIPPLAERREDIPYLIDHFIQRFNAKRGKKIEGVTPAVMEVLMRHEFPGNVRELENLIEYGFVLCHNRLIDMEHLPEDCQATAHPASSGQVSPQAVSRLQRAESEAIRGALVQHGGHLGHVAKELGVSRTTLWRKLNKYGIDANEFRSAVQD
jgi:DNA-binding NtrC family response regulator